MHAHRVGGGWAAAGVVARAMRVPLCAAMRMFYLDYDLHGTRGLGADDYRCSRRTRGRPEYEQQRLNDMPLECPFDTDVFEYARSGSAAPLHPNTFCQCNAAVCPLYATRAHTMTSPLLGGLAAVTQIFLCDTHSEHLEAIGAGIMGVAACTPQFRTDDEGECEFRGCAASSGITSYRVSYTRLQRAVTLVLCDAHRIDVVVSNYRAGRLVRK